MKFSIHHVTLLHTRNGMQWFAMLPSTCVEAIKSMIKTTKTSSTSFSTTTNTNKEQIPIEKQEMLYPLQIHLGRTSDIAFNRSQCNLVYRGLEPHGKALASWIRFLLLQMPSIESALNFALCELGKHSLVDMELGNGTAVAGNLLRTIIHLAEEDLKQQR